jgi:transposase
MVVHLRLTTFTENERKAFDEETYPQGSVTEEQQSRQAVCRNFSKATRDFAWSRLPGGIGRGMGGIRRQRTLIDVVACYRD